MEIRLAREERLVDLLRERTLARDRREIPHPLVAGRPVARCPDREDLGDGAQVAGGQQGITTDLGPGRRAPGSRPRRLRLPRPRQPAPTHPPHHHPASPWAPRRPLAWLATSLSGSVQPVSGSATVNRPPLGTTPSFHRGERQRPHPDPQSGRRHPARRWPAQPTATAPRGCPGRQGIRLEGRTPGTAAPQDPAGHLPQGCPEHQGPGQAPLRRRADVRPAPPVQTSRHPMETTPRTPRRLGLVGRQPHLLETPEEVRIMNLRCSSRSYGSRSSWRMTQDPGPKPADAVS